MAVGLDSVIPLSCDHAVCICSSFSELPGHSYKESLALCMRNKIRKSGQPESEAEWETLQPPLLFKGTQEEALQSHIVFSTGRTHAIYFITNLFLEFLKTHWSKYNSSIIKLKICDLPLAIFSGFYVFYTFYFNFYICLIEYYVL